jgi:hypothetical protein
MTQSIVHPVRSGFTAQGCVSVSFLSAQDSPCAGAAPIQEEASIR